MATVISMEEFPVSGVSEVSETFNVLMIERSDGGVEARIESVSEDALPDGDVTVRVAYSSLNYKDGLVLLGQGGLVRDYPHVPGIDFAGTVESSRSPVWKPGDAVVLTGWFVGERQWGGHAQRARVKAEWLVPLPEGLTPKRAMALGTAGLTAMLCVLALEKHGLEAGAGDVLVTGAGGGVGSVAVALLAALGHRVVASTGRAETHDYLRDLGAAEIIDRAELATPSKRPLDKERWAGAVDTVGSHTLAAILRGLRHGASVAACGLAGGADLPATVIPFLLRGVNLLGIDSVRCPIARRRRAWDRLARDLPADKLDAATEVVPLAKVVELAPRIINGQVRGRVVVDVNA